MANKKKGEDLIKLDSDLSFDDAMRLIVNAPKEDVEKAIEDSEELEPDLDYQEEE